MPRVEIVQKHNTAARRLYIRGHNGKIYPYLVMNDACLTESRREERVLQLLRLLNPCLEKRKETTKRHLFFTGRGTSFQKGRRFTSNALPCLLFCSPQQLLLEKMEICCLHVLVFNRSDYKNLQCCMLRPLLSFVLSLSLNMHNFNLLLNAVSSPVTPLWFESTQMFACSPFMH